MPVRSSDQTYENDTIPDSWDDFYAGQNVVYNGTEDETQEFHVIINGKSKSKSVSTKTYSFSVVRCDASCDVEDIIVVEDEYEDEEIPIRYWSDTSNWPDETLPIEGDNVTIPNGRNMILDIEETPIFEKVEI